MEGTDVPRIQRDPKDQRPGGAAKSAEAAERAAAGAAEASATDVPEASAAEAVEGSAAGAPRATTVGWAPPGRPRNSRRWSPLPELPYVGGTLEHLLGSRTRARVLACVLADPPHSLWLRQVCREVGMGASNVQRELAWLTAIGLLAVERLGGAHLYRVDETHPLCAPLRRLLTSASEVDAACVVPRPDGGSKSPVWFR